jgi:hypothetical protein
MARELAHAYGKKRRKIERKLQKRVALDPQQLEPLLRSPDEEIRRAASEVVEEMGPNAAPLAEVLATLLSIEKLALTILTNTGLRTHLPLSGLPAYL